MDLFSLISDEINALTQRDAVLFFRELLWVESSHLGIARQLISVPDNINAGDGGLDAKSFYNIIYKLRWKTKIKLDLTILKIIMRKYKLK